MKKSNIFCLSYPSYFLLPFPGRKLQKLLKNYNVYCQDDWPSLITVTETHYLQFPAFSERESFSLFVQDIEYNMGRTKLVIRHPEQL